MIKIIEERVLLPVSANTANAAGSAIPRLPKNNRPNVNEIQQRVASPVSANTVNNTNAENNVYVAGTAILRLPKNFFMDIEKKSYFVEKKVSKNHNAVIIGVEEGRLFFFRKIYSPIPIIYH